MNPKLSQDIEQFVTSDPSGIVKVEGVQGMYFVVTEEAMQVRQYVQDAIKEVDCGDVSEWNTEELLRKARDLKEQRSA